MQDISAQIAQRLQPVAPQLTPYGQPPTQDLLAQLAQQHADALTAAKGNGILGSSLGATPVAATDAYAPGRASEAAQAQMYQSILKDHADALKRAQPGYQEATVAQQLANDPTIADKINTLELHTGSPQGQAQLNAYRNQLAQQYPGAYMPTGKTNTQAAQAQLAQGSGVRRAQYMDARRQAEAKYYQDRSNAMAAAQNQGFSLGGLAQAFNPFAGVGRIAGGQGRPGDYLKYGLMFL